MRLLTPDPGHFPRPAERFHWRWNRIFLAGMLGPLLVLAALLAAKHMGIAPDGAPEGVAGALLGSAAGISLLGGLVLPAASWAAGWAREGRSGVTGMLAAGASAVGLLVGGLGALQLVTGSPLVRTVGGGLVIAGGALALVAALGGAAERGRWPGFGSSMIASTAFLGALLIPTSDHVPETAYLAAVKSDLRNLASRQELHRTRTGSYGSSLEALDFEPSRGVRLTVAATADGWVARGFHAELDSECATFSGSVPAPPARRPDEVACTVEPAELRALGRQRGELSLAASIAGAFLVVFLLALPAAGPGPRLTRPGTGKG